MAHMAIRITGIPYGRHKRRGNIDALDVWTKEVIRQTKDLAKIEHACILKVTFLLPSNKYPGDFPYGSDLDNLLKRFFDAQNVTIFANAPGKDSCVISINATKAKVSSDKEAGALLEILPINL